MPIQFQPLSNKNKAKFKKMTFPIYVNSIIKMKIGKEIFGMTVEESDFPIGLILAEPKRSIKEVKILSIFLEKKYRDKGVGKELIRHFINYIKTLGCQKIKIVYEQGRKYSQIINKLAKGASFSPEKVRGIMCRCLGSKLRKAPWLQKQLLPSSFQLFPWKEITSSQKIFIKDQYLHLESFPEMLNPFHDKQIIEYLNSLGLLYDNEVVGWQINHRIAEDTIRYTAMYVREDLQKFGLAIPLMIESIRKHIYCGNFNLNKATFFIPEVLNPMTEFVNNHMKPFIDQINQSIEREVIL
tara:strand:- start:4224 stop:5114 length:891 start_codon:yes stop_codon:yes gene_type:complete